MSPPERWLWLVPLLAIPAGFVLIWWERHTSVHAPGLGRAVAQPTTPAEARAALRRGRRAGIALLAAVGASIALSFALGPETVDRRQRQYSTGVAALERGDWAAARAALHAAGDYADAPQKIRESYRGEAFAEAGRGQWSAAVKAIVAYDQLSVARDADLARLISATPRLREALERAEPSFSRRGGLTFIGRLEALAPVDALAYGPADHQLLVATDAGGSAAVEQWDLATLRREQVLAAGQERDVSPQPGPRLAVELSRDRKRILLTPTHGAAPGDEIALWNVGQPSPRLHLAGALARFSPGSSQLVGTNERGRLTVWRADTGAVLAQAALGHAEVVDVALGPQGQSLIVADARGRVSRWAMPGLEAPESLAVSGTRLATGGDGRLVAIASEAAVTVLDLQTGAIVLEATAASPVVALAFSPDGALLALGAAAGGVGASSGGAVALWDVQAGEQITGIEQLSDDVSGLAFSRDGRTLAVASRSSGVSFWRL